MTFTYSTSEFIRSFQTIKLQFLHVESKLVGYKYFIYMGKISMNIGFITSKFALDGVTIALAAEYSKNGI